MISTTIQHFALGDSYTIGEEVSHDQNWPNQLAALLRTQGIKISDPKIIAKTGWTTRDLLNAISKEKITNTYDLVSLLIGVNNQYQGFPLNEYQHEFHLLLKHAIHYAGEIPLRVLVLSIPDWGVTPYATGQDRDRIRSEIDDFNTVNFSETEHLGTHYVDITQISRRVGSEKDFLAGDNLHPSGKMYSEWVNLIYPTVWRILNPNGSR
jgi:lysophospholipase L1-like esterase